MIQHRIERIFKTIEKASSDCGRDISEITLIGVTKTKPLVMIRDAFEAGLADFGENYVEDFSDKERSYHPSGLNYHFIGRLPTKKVRKIVGKAHLIHSVGSVKLANKIDLVSSEENVRQDILIQVNQGGELSKSGIEPDDLEALVEEVLALPNIRIRGLMSIPPFHEPAQPHFYQLRHLRNNLQEKLGIELPFLSMGMSGDFVEAISEGATHIRVGTSIFGSR
jgi:pyridoxal phosphate enzyme (YggS family)